MNRLLCHLVGVCDRFKFRQLGTLRHVEPKDSGLSRDRKQNGDVLPNRTGRTFVFDKLIIGREIVLIGKLPVNLTGAGDRTSHSQLQRHRPRVFDLSRPEKGALSITYYAK